MQLKCNLTSECPDGTTQQVEGNSNPLDKIRIFYFFLQMVKKMFSNVENTEKELFHSQSF